MVILLRCTEYLFPVASQCKYPFKCIFFHRAVTRRLRDKLVSYMLVLALIIDEYSLDCGVIIKDLGLAPSRYERYFNIKNIIVNYCITNMSSCVTI